MMLVGAQRSAGGARNVSESTVAGGSGSIDDHAPMPITRVSPASQKNCSRDGPPSTPQPSSLTAITALVLLHCVATKIQLSKSEFVQFATRYTPACGAVKLT